MQRRGSDRPHLICIEQQGAYVAGVMVRVLLPIEGAPDAWLTLISQDDVPVGRQPCVTAPAGSLRLTVYLAAFTGFNWQDACRFEVAPVVATKVTMRGTTFHPSCHR
ncbi:hypothetical protein ACLF3G_00005 [Falsiroseomonas sp. HC035]|uniref:hypothetical protein n=1 Tax=Falsiroseomonas sp. HC035 TaxID=3390999 RepID=UPI003D312C2F